MKICVPFGPRLNRRSQINCFLAFWGHRFLLLLGHCLGRAHCLLFIATFGRVNDLIRQMIVGSHLHHQTCLNSFFVCSSNLGCLKIVYFHRYHLLTFVVEYLMIILIAFIVKEEQTLNLVESLYLLMDLFFKWTTLNWFVGEEVTE